MSLQFLHIQRTVMSVVIISSPLLSGGVGIQFGMSEMHPHEMQTLCGWLFAVMSKKSGIPNTPKRCISPSCSISPRFLYTVPSAILGFSIRASSKIASAVICPCSRKRFDMISRCCVMKTSFLRIGIILDCIIPRISRLSIVFEKIIKKLLRLEKRCKIFICIFFRSRR